MSAKLINGNGLSRTAGGGILGARYVLLADDFGLSLIIQFECIRAECHAGATADASLLINFYHVILLRKSPAITAFGGIPPSILNISGGTNGAHANIID